MALCCKNTDEAVWVTAATMALLTDFETLAKLTSVGTMFVTGMVAACLLWRRYHDSNSLSVKPALFRLLAIIACAFGVSIMSNDARIACDSWMRKAC